MTESNNVRGHFKTLLLDADLAIWARQDRTARAMGWRISRTRFGGRVYRDPRFDGLRVTRAQEEREEPVEGLRDEFDRGGGLPPVRGFHRRRRASA
ncbi:hypothetical protein [Sphaerisporangium aureirubrum]|uniref:Uncharacterized protein n=1 Tax=Sphaerisporangium aureirubrum TaxID=1544736 RepID=A0ABW1NLU0_9ACTN